MPGVGAKVSVKPCLLEETDNGGGATTQFSHSGSLEAYASRVVLNQDLSDRLPSFLIQYQ